MHAPAQVCLNDSPCCALILLLLHFRKETVILESGMVSFGTAVFTRTCGMKVERKKTHQKQTAIHLSATCYAIINGSALLMLPRTQNFCSDWEVAEIKELMEKRNEVGILKNVRNGYKIAQNAIN